MTTQQPTTETTMTSKLSLEPKNVLYIAITLLGMGCAYLLYRNWALKNEFTHERNTIRITAQNNQLLANQQQLMFGMKTFVWAVRNAMLQNKPGEINEYFNTLVQNKGVQEMLLVDPAGRVTLSTNKKNQGIVFASRFPGYLLQQEDVYFNNKAVYELSAPVTAPNKRLGTLVLFYKPTPVLPAPAANE
ncbi:hypothetical protein [Spirosoma radiotolerans]|uniref:Uncharacterized protein n=1 Tax=Spirosoma radiotolerans TaxID=1379870 RepID=A0A0E3V5Y1_9BACT|nr:hypothetical protein [Spirosoma radiotolerans]AKD54051.1 hypothetical protein SD10_03160 [Spirosoma radiotolerans]